MDERSATGKMKMAKRGGVSSSSVRHKYNLPGLTPLAVHGSVSGDLSAASHSGTQVEGSSSVDLLRVCQPSDSSCQASSSGLEGRFSHHGLEDNVSVFPYQRSSYNKRLQHREQEEQEDGKERQEGSASISAVTRETMGSTAGKEELLTNSAGTSVDSCSDSDSCTPTSRYKPLESSEYAARAGENCTATPASCYKRTLESELMTRGGESCTAESSQGTLQYGCQSHEEEGLERIRDNLPALNSLVRRDSPCLTPPTPDAPLEILTRSWQIAAVELENHISQLGTHRRPLDPRLAIEGALRDADEMGIETVPHTVAPPDVANDVMERILSPEMLHGLLGLDSGYGYMKLSNGCAKLSNGYTKLSADIVPYQLTNVVGNIPKARQRRRGDSYGGAHAYAEKRSVGRWFKDWREKRKEIHRTHAAEVHAAVAVAGAAAAVAAVTAATAAAATTENGGKLSCAVASAAALVASECVNVAESIGADRDVLSSTVRSAVHAKTAGDIATLTAAAATALRGAAILKARYARETRLQKLTPTGHRKRHSMDARISAAGSSSGGGGGHNSSGEDGWEGDSLELEAEERGVLEDRTLLGFALNLSRGNDLLTRSKKGNLHWRRVYLYIEKSGQVAVRLQNKVMGGITNTKKYLVLGISGDVSPWPGRSLLENGEEHRYFRLHTNRGDLEFETNSTYEYQLWVEGTARLLAYAQSIS
ncbi:hypothetical protein CBR_g29841 [Chara braunii]|uniref:PH domain-containing protein n=1 Tax=Chara braunii TaxID=69332 RepID=A0A388JWP4_CHABU|nr:hypothetical protein CBR_g29841 [Chara braunii]|eukprot:GBG62234.1 hypothetical protein CBR_g29841 [Chara braunii]